jgi:hypothetical protein
MLAELRRIGQSPGNWRVAHDRIPLEIAAKVYATVLELGKTDPSPVRIARLISAKYTLSLSPGTVRHWIVGDRRLQRRNVFREEPSPSLSYVIGANIGDGCTLAKDSLVKLEVTDFDFAETFNSKMASSFSRERPNKIMVKRFRVNRLPLYVVKYFSKQLVKLLRMPLKKVLEFALAFPREFLREFFDAEGHVDVGITDRFYLRVGVENSDRRLLLEVKQSLKRLGIDSRFELKRKAGTIKMIRDKTFKMRRPS